MELRLDDRTIPLRPAEWRLLLRLAQEPGCCVTWDALYNAIWSEPLAEPGQIYAHASRIRAKLRPFGAARYLRTIRKHGLLLDLPRSAVLIRGTLQQAQALARAQRPHVRHGQGGGGRG